MKKSSSFLTALLLAFTAILFVTCKKEEPKPQTIYDILTTDPQFSQFRYHLIHLSRVDSALQGAAPHTVFAPSDLAFDHTNLLNGHYGENGWQSYHIVEGSYESKALPDGQTYGSSFIINAPEDNHNTMLISKTSSGVKVDNFAEVVTADIIASNGVIHVINEVLKPLTLTEFVDANPDLDSLQRTMFDTDHASLYNYFDPQLGSVRMMLAPTNSAFEAATNETNTLTDAQMLNLLKYHIVEGFVSSPYITEGMTFTTQQGEIITFHKNGNGFSISDAKGNSANIIGKQINTRTGIVYMLDKVLFPMNL